MKRHRLLLGLIGTLLVIILALSMITPALAAEPEPETVSLTDIVIFNGLIVTGDWLAVVPYSITFDTEPTPTIDDAYIFRLFSPDGATENGTALATPAYNGGYGPGVVSFYFTSGMDTGEAYIFRVQQSPTYYPSPQYWDFVVGASNYSELSDQSAALRAKIIDSATSLTPTFGEALLASSEAGTTVLSTYGELYYLAAIPGLQSMCPELFSVQLVDPDFTKRTWSTTFADALKTKYSGTFVYDAMTGFAGLFTVGTSAAMNTLSIFAFAILIGVSIWKFKGTMLSAFIDGYALLLLLMLMGFFDMIMAGAMAFISAVIGGAILLLSLIHI